MEGGSEAREDTRRAVVGPTDAIPELSVVVPVVNGAGFISESLAELGSFLQRRHLDAEIVVVDDGSGDETVSRIELAATACPVPVVVRRHERNLGKGAAVRTGMQAARGRFRVFVDADLAYPATEIGAVLERLRAGARVVIASRVHPESRYLIRPSFFRYLYTRHISGRFFNWLVRVLLLPGVSDTQAGLKGFSAEAAETLFGGWLPDGFGFDLAVLAKARQAGMQVVEVPVMFRYDREPTTMRFVADTFDMLRDLAAVRLRIGRGGIVGTGTGIGMASRGRGASQPVVLSWPVLAAALLLLVGVELTRGHAHFLVPVGLWAAGLVAWLARAWRDDRARGVPGVRWICNRGEAWTVLGITGLAAFLRLAALTSVPAFMHHDTASCGLVGRDLLTGVQSDPFAFCVGWYHFPALGLLPYALSLKLLGTTVLALRVTSAIPGLLAVLALYYLVRGWFGRVPAAVAAFLLATNHVAVHFSRAGVWNIQALLLGLAGLSALFGGWRRRSAFWLAVAGVCLGTSLYTYTAGRLFLGLGMMSFAALLWRSRPRDWRLAAQLMVALGLAAAPLLGSFVRVPSALKDDRLRAVSPFAEPHRAHVEGQVGSSEPLAVLLHQVKRTLGGFTHLGDQDANYGTVRPLISPVTLSLAVLGLGLALARLPDGRFALLLVWLVVGLVAGSVLAIDPPSFPRLLVVLPVPLVLAAVILGLIWEKTRSLGQLERRLGMVVVAVAAVVALIVNARGYVRFVDRMEVEINEWAVRAALDRVTPARTVYLFTGAFMLADSPVFEFFRDGRRLVTGLSELDLPETLSEPTAFVLAPQLRHVGTTLTDRFPLLERETLATSGVWQLTIYRSWDEHETKGNQR